MTATEELRRMLDERGVKYFRHEDGEPLRELKEAGEPATSWFVGDVSVCAVPNKDGELFDLWIDHCTAEQAIVATLDERTCHNAWAMSDRDTDAAMFVCSECKTWVGKRVYWHPVDPSGEKYLVLDCDVKYCPNCGRKVVEYHESD